MLFQRDIVRKLIKVLYSDEFLVVTGARQSGKTSILILLKNYLEQKGETASYLNLENSLYLNSIDQHPYNIFEFIPAVSKRQFVFIDEIQYLKNPTNFLKLLFDEKRANLKIIASGSSSFYIDKTFKDSLSGRKFLFELYPLNFNEFLVFNKQDELLEQKEKKLSRYYADKLLEFWESYILYGGYPKVVLADNAQLKKIIIEDIGSSYIKKDISDAGIRNTDKYFHLIKILAGQAGRLVNSQELSATLQTPHKTIEEYFYVMKKSYQVSFIKPFYKNIRKELTKMPKVYFNDLGLRNFFLNDYSPISKRNDKGAYLENIVFKELLSKTGNIDLIKFWRTQDKKEVDFITGDNAYEVKYEAVRKPREYEFFKRQYPEIRLKFITQKDILKYFYSWK